MVNSNKRIIECILASLLMAALSVSAVLAGEYSNGTNTPDAIDAGIPGILEDRINPVFSGWAVTVVEYYPSDETDSYGIDGIGPSPYTGNDFSNPANALGPVTTSDLDVVSLGDLNWEDGVTYDIDDEPGFITLSFPEAVSNGPGPDFAVFENTFGSGGLLPAELAFVEVSTNGTDFARFPSYYNASSEPVGPYGYIDVTKIWNLAGKHINSTGGSWGTPFNLSDLSDNPLILDNTVNLEQINYIRIVDIAGNGYFTDSQGNPIYDAWETWGSGGFDLNAVGILENINGDGDSNGEVNFHDFLRLHTNWNKTGGWPQGDFNEDGLIDVTDFLLLAENWLYRNK